MKVITAILLASVPVSAYRNLEHHGVKAGISTRAITHTAELVDVTPIVAEQDKQGTLRCCCDKESDKWWQRDNGPHSGICKVFKQKSVECKSKQSDASSWGATGDIHHFTRTKGSGGGKCTVSVKEAAELLGADYCSSYSPPMSAKLGQVVQVSCPAGEEPEAAQTTCTFGVAVSGGGVFSPRPSCKKAATWCSGTSRDSSNLLAEDLPAVAHGQEVPVRCSPGYDPEVATVTCGDDRKFAPMPRCKEQPEWCQQYVGEDEEGLPKVGHASEYNGDAVVECVTGYEPTMEKVTCNSEKNYEPKPSCSKIADFCLSRKWRSKPGRPSVTEAALGDHVPVVCEEGYEASVETLVCSQRGDWDQTPECKQVMTVMGAKVFKT